MTNITPESVLNLARRLLEVKGTQHKSMDVQSIEHGKLISIGSARDLDVRLYENGNVFIQYRHGHIPVMGYHKETDTIILVEGPSQQRYLEDIVRLIGEVLPLEALAVIE
jgi:hypothetical protein